MRHHGKSLFSALTLSVSTIVNAAPCSDLHSLSVAGTIRDTRHTEKIEATLLCEEKTVVLRMGQKTRTGFIAATDTHIDIKDDTGATWSMRKQETESWDVTYMAGAVKMEGVLSEIKIN